jgi:hypothetical protein
MENITDESYIGLICNGEFNAIPDFKIGELFESFFDNINYNVVKENSNVYVDFTGEAICDEEPCTILIRFKVDDNAEEFEISEVKVDEDILNEDEVLDLLEDIAYVGGAVIEEDYCSECGEDSCSHCFHDCANTEDEENDNEDDDDYDDDEDEDDEDENKTDDNDDDDNK